VAPKRKKAVYLAPEKEEMHKFPDGIQTVLSAVSHCAKHNGCNVFLRGNLVLYHLTGNSEFLQEQQIDLVISYEAGFDTHQLYQCLIQHVTISREIENSSSRYHIISLGYEIKIDLIHQFDPTRLMQANRFGSFNLDMLFYDLFREEIRHPPGVLADVNYLKNTKMQQDWIFEDILGFVMWIGRLAKVTVDDKQLEHLKSISLGLIKESLDVTWEEQIENILLLRRSGAALRFIAATFVDGMAWTFKVFIDYMISMNVGINEESNIETVFNEKKFELVDLYNEFFLADKKVKETADEIYHRLNTILKLLFDSPNLSIPRPYINKIRTMAGGVLGRCCLGSNSGGSISFFGCGTNIEEEECIGFPVNCSTPGSGQCLREHPSFAHIPELNWDLISVDHREWCPNQVCPDADNIHCLQEASSSSSSSERPSSSSSHSSSSFNSSSSYSSSSSAEACLECPSYNSQVTSYPVTDNDWFTTSGTVDANGCYTVRFTNLPDKPGFGWTFKCGCEDGASATFETEMDIVQTTSCTAISHIDDTCNDGTNDQWLITSVTGPDDHVYVKVTEVGGGPGGSFTMAYAYTAPA
jgi:hypothetical protein